MRKATAALVVAMAVLATLATPASAEKPPREERSATFPAVNPCTGVFELVTLNWTVTVHENRRNRVETFDTVAQTTSGFTGTGTETQVITKKQKLNTLNIRLTDGEQVMMVKGHRAMDLETGAETMNSFRSYCLGG